MRRLSDEVIKGIRTKPWYINKKNLLIDSEVIKETVKELCLKKCPICKGELKNKDNFETPLPSKRFYMERYCPNENYIISLAAHNYEGNGGSGTTLSMEIFTNSKNFVTIADSGVLADISKEVDLCYLG